MDHSRNRLLVGVFVIVFGVLALLDNLGLFDARIAAWWPLVFVALGLSHLAQRPDARGAVLGVAGILVGVTWTLNNLGVIHVRMRELWPLFIIYAGVSLIARGYGPARPRRLRGDAGGDPGTAPPGAVDPTVSPGGPDRVEHGSRVDASAVLSGIVLRNDSKDFRGGEINAAMGSVQLDLTQAAIVTEARLEVSVVMSGVKILVPRDWSVSVNGTPLLGGIEDKTVPPIVPGRRLVLDASVVLGSIELSN